MLLQRPGAFLIMRKITRPVARPWRRRRRRSRRAGVSRAPLDRECARQRLRPRRVIRLPRTRVLVAAQIHPETDHTVRRPGGVLQLEPVAIRCVRQHTQCVRLGCRWRRARRLGVTVVGVAPAGLQKAVGAAILVEGVAARGGDRAAVLAAGIAAGGAAAAATVYPTKLTTGAACVVSAPVWERRKIPSRCSSLSMCSAAATLPISMRTKFVKL